MAPLSTEQSRVELFFEASRCDGPVMEAQPAAAGFDDITWTENLVLLGLYPLRHAPPALPQELGLGPEATEELTVKLIQRGHPGQDGATDRGRRALLSTMVIVRLTADLTGQMRYLAQRPKITVPEALWPELVRWELLRRALVRRHGRCLRCT